MTKGRCPTIRAVLSEIAREAGQRFGDRAVVVAADGVLTYEELDRAADALAIQLSQRGVAGFEEVFGTPHGKDLAAIASAIGVPAKTISTQAELKSELASPIKGVSVVVITAPDREANADFLKKVYSQVDSM